ncbi:piwi-like protein Ago3 [Stegodyphus dumicola]|uniref:piwi-like protein Ago3 n=1 Tax=Stegodyphus dumicola TaxID=202533 RepID=UPI0015ACEF62|nr:piwi-like protein Ago3 [Stegodyphus dumicola]
MEGIGRGGRGALLLAALKNQPRRPGQTSESDASADSTSSEQSSEPKPLGRGAFLKSLLQTGRGRAVPSAEESEIRRPVGRGRGLILSTVSSDARESPDVPSTSSSSPSQYSPPSSDFQNLSLKSEVGPLKPSIEGRGRGLALSSISSNVPGKVKEVFSSGTTEKVSPRVPPVSSPTPKKSPLEFQGAPLSSYQGTSGKPLHLEVNYVRLRTVENKGIYEYHVNFVPSVDSKSMKFRLMNDASVKEVIGNVKTFDGSKLYLPLKLMTSPVNIEVHMPTDNSLVSVSIKFVKECQPNDCLHLYNLLFRKVMRILKMTQVGRNYFDPQGGIPVPKHRLEIWPGYVTAVQEYEGGVMLNCDASFRVLRSVTAHDLMHEASKQRGGDMRDAITKDLIGCVVLTRYNNKTYSVDDIAWDMNPCSTFVSHNGGEISFVEYYRRSYDIEIKDMKQPLLVSKTKKKKENEETKLICLIPELCYMTGLTDAMRNDFRVMKDIASFTRINPTSRQLTLQKYIDNVNQNSEAKACFLSWNLELDPRPLNLEGRLLKSEDLNFGRNNVIHVSPEADWGRQAVTTPVLVPVNFEKWVIVFPKREQGKIRDFIKMLRTVCPAMGINVNPPQTVELVNDRTESYCEALRGVINPTVQIVVVVFPTPRDDRYSAVKKLCCIEMPIPSQAINLKTISDVRKLRSVVQKIALQMNCKLGGELWSIHIPLDNLMVCGLDTYHDMTRGRRSVLAFVASINQNRTRWYSMTTMQKAGQEMGDSLKMLFISALRKYFEINHKLPDKIILYRDGVGDGQMDYVAKYEVEQLTSCFKHFSVDYSPTLSVIVVQKRINTRMYTIMPQTNTLENPPPGSILDHTVTRKKWYDFFLISQHVRQGTVSPTHYVVIYDSSTLKPEHVQRVTYKMTHMYYNWPGTVRVPAPCQYAHKLAYLVGQNLHKETHVDLCDRLFYL